jgi:hypothetical protein
MRMLRENVPEDVTRLGCGPEVIKSNGKWDGEVFVREGHHMEADTRETYPFHHWIS